MFETLCVSRWNLRFREPSIAKVCWPQSSTKWKNPQSAKGQMYYIRTVPVRLFARKANMKLTGRPWFTRRRKIPVLCTNLETNKIKIQKYTTEVHDYDDCKSKAKV